MSKLSLIIVLNFIKKIKSHPYPLLDFCLDNFIQKEYEVVTKEGVKFLMRPKRNKIVGDIDILYEILIEDQYLIKQLLKPDYKIIDIGGQAGFFSILASKIIGNRGKIYVFEPFKPNFDQLIKNIKLNKIKNIKAFNKAVTRRSNGMVNLYISEQNIGAHSLMADTNNQCIKVKSISLKKIFKDNSIKRIDLLKIDCEGSEYEILLKTPRNIINKINTIILEQHITSNTKKYAEKSIIDSLRDNGFSARVLKEIYYENEGNFFIILAQRNVHKQNGSNSIRTKHSRNY